jgi:hypothetical protein
MAGQVPIGQNKLIPSGLFLFGAPVVSLATSFTWTDGFHLPVSPPPGRDASTGK